MERAFGRVTIALLFKGDSGVPPLCELEHGVAAAESPAPARDPSKGAAASACTKRSCESAASLESPVCLGTHDGSSALRPCGLEPGRTRHLDARSRDPHELMNERTVVSRTITTGSTNFLPPTAGRSGSISSGRSRPQSNSRLGHRRRRSGP
jgi:hypothetical protein